MDISTGTVECSHPQNTDAEAIGPFVRACNKNRTTMRRGVSTMPDMKATLPHGTKGLETLTFHPRPPSDPEGHTGLWGAVKAAGDVRQVWLFAWNGGNTHRVEKVLEGTLSVAQTVRNAEWPSEYQQCVSDITNRATRVAAEAVAAAFVFDEDPLGAYHSTREALDAAILAVDEWWETLQACASG